jgi:hypothetical protein
VNLTTFSATLLLLAQQVPILTARADAAPLTVSEIHEIKRICQSLFGAPAKNAKSLLRPLSPYIRSSGELDHHRWVCSSQHCSGAVGLRDGSAVIYSFVSIPDPKSTDPTDITADRVRKGNNRINAIGLIKERKVIFAIPPKAAQYLVQ